MVLVSIFVYISLILMYNKLEKKKKILEGDDLLLVTKQAPDFTAPAFHKGKITKVSLGDYRGKWLVLCFYPGDFTFV